MATKRAFILKDLSDLNFRIKNGDIQISDTYLKKLGFNKGTLGNRLSMFAMGKSEQYQFEKSSSSNVKWIQFSSIPIKILNRFSIPILEDVLKIELKKVKYSIKNSEDLTHIWSVLRIAWSGSYFEYLQVFRCFKKYKLLIINMFLMKPKWLITRRRPKIRYLFPLQCITSLL
ncbi:hypothetical protein [Aquimarina algiphila]|uniref:hypothetical protein n=1 Tax=Aquimarina algiphila TaxID=2047982 RepID=UPI0024924C5A|nr:hypothetical protein [Aquimarina algiphila]